MQSTNPDSTVPFSPWPDGEVGCVWLPHFPLRVEVLQHPAWDGRPLVLGSSHGERKVVQLCSPEAARSGIRPGLPLREVLSLCRDAIILQPNPVRTAMVLEEIVRRLQRVSPVVEAGADRGILDLRGLRGVYRGDLGNLERAIRAAVPPVLRPRIGVARGKFTASIAACQAPLSGVHVVPPAETTAFLAPLPISHLPLPPEALRRLELLGLRKIADLAALPFAAVQAEFGPAGARSWRLAHGQDDEPVIPSRFELGVRVSLRFDNPVASTETIAVALKHLLARAFGNPDLSGRSVRQVRLRALLADGTSWERLITFKEALASQDAAYRALKSKLELPNALPTAPIDELSLELIGLGNEVVKQPGMFSARTRRLGPIAEAARQLRARYGRVPLYRIVEVEPWSRIPERRWALMPYDP